VKVVPSKIKKTIFILIAADIIRLKYLDKDVHLQLAMLTTQSVSVNELNTTQESIITGNVFPVHSVPTAPRKMD
jgi:hypothetical protein